VNPSIFSRTCETIYISPDLQPTLNPKLSTPHPNPLTLDPKPQHQTLRSDAGDDGGADAAASSLQVQGYLANKKQRLPRTLQWEYA